MILLLLITTAFQLSNHAECAREMPALLQRPYTPLAGNLGVPKLTIRRGPVLRFGEGPGEWDEARSSPIRACLAVFTPAGKRIFAKKSQGKDEHINLADLGSGEYRFWAESLGYFPLDGYVTISRFHGTRQVCVQMIPNTATDTVSSWMVKCP